MSITAALSKKGNEEVIFKDKEINDLQQRIETLSTAAIKFHQTIKNIEISKTAKEKIYSNTNGIIGFIHTFEAQLKELALKHTNTPVSGDFLNELKANVETLAKFNANLKDVYTKSGISQNNVVFGFFDRLQASMQQKGLLGQGIALNK